jgi:cytochrome c556
MHANGKKLMLTILSIAAAVIVSQPVRAENEHTHGHHVDTQKDHAQSVHEHSSNPLVEEMNMLDAVFRDIVSGVAINDNKRVHDALETMHGTMDKTHEGVHQGTVKLKKNTQRLKEFIEMDKQFHAKLEELAKAAHSNNEKTMLSLTKDLLDRCVQCHREFRAP